MYSLPPRPSNVLIAYQARQCNVHIAYLATWLDGALSLRPGGAYVGQRLTLVRTRSQLRCKTGEPHSFGYVLWLRPPSLGEFFVVRPPGLGDDRLLQRTTQYWRMFDDCVVFIFRSLYVVCGLRFVGISTTCTWWSNPLPAYRTP